jgi:hypothetical protein
VLAVGATRPRFLWLLATVAPSIFSGIAAVLLLVPMSIALLTGGRPAPWPVVAADAFGFLSALAALVLVWRRFRFLRQSQTAQRGWAIGAWAIHLAAFAGLMAILALV